MGRIEEIDRQQDQILDTISGIRTMVQGSVNVIYNNNTRKDGTPGKNGPYFNLTRKPEKGKTITQCLKTGEVESYQEQAANHLRFKELASNYMALSEERFQLMRLHTSEKSEGAKKNGKSKR